ncbi:GIY-YIG nuclease family protein, partial [Aequorivita todarodis]
MATVYILYSKSVDGYYTGSCLDFTERFQRHLDKTYFDSYTRKASDWTL